MKKLTTQQNLDQIKRTQFLLTKGELIQKRAVFENLYSIIAKFPQSFSNFFPIIKQSIKDGDSQIQISIGRQLKKIISLNIITIDQKLYNELMAINLRMLQQWNDKSTEFWIEIFGVLIQKQYFCSCEKETLMIINRLSDSKQILPIKIVAAKAIGYLSKILKNKLKGTILDRIRVFCRDPQKQLKIVILTQVLPKLIRNLSMDLIENYFTEKIFEMVYEDNLQIKLAALSLVFQHCQYFPTLQKQSRIINMLIQNLQSTNQEIQLFVSKKMGQIYIKLRQYLLKNNSNTRIFLNSVKRYSNSLNEQIILNFLYNLPGLLYYLDLQLWKQVSNTYINIIQNHQNIEVRSFGFLIFYKIVQICGFKNFEDYPQIVVDILNNFVKQENSEKKKGLLTKAFPSFLENIEFIILEIYKQCILLEQKQQNNEFLYKILQNICKSLIQILKHVIPYNKPQIVQTIHQKFSLTYGCFSSNQLMLEYIPTILTQLTNFNQITINQIIKYLCEILKSNIVKIDTDIILKKLETEFLKSNIYFRRIIYIRIAKFLLQYFSIEKYRSYGIFQNCLNITRDKILSVRLELIDYFLVIFTYMYLLPQQIQLIFQIINYYKISSNEYIQEKLTEINKWVNLSKEQKDKQQQMRKIQNQQKLRHQQILVHSNLNNMTNNKNEDVELRKTDKKTTIFKQPKKIQFNVKYNNKIKTKINISLSTNMLNNQNSLKFKQSNKSPQKKQQILLSQQKKQKKPIEQISKTKKISEVIIKSEQVDRKKKQSIEGNNIKNILQKDFNKRSSLDVSKKKKNTTEKKIIK